MCIGAGAGSGSTRFRVPEKVPKVPVKVWEALVQSQVSFNRVPVPGGFGGKPGQVQQGSEEGSGEGLGGFDAEPRQVQQGSGEGSGEGLGGFSGEGSGEGLGGFDAEPRQVQQGSGEGSGAEPGQVQQGSGEGSGEGLGGFGVEPGQVQQVFPALGFAARFRKICKHWLLRLLGIPLNLIFEWLEPGAASARGCCDAGATSK